jgi:hypothetical protein
VVLGNPSAGGAYPAPMLAPLWRAIGPWLPPGVGTDAIRGMAYFAGAGVSRAALIMAGYAGLGLLTTLVAATVQEPRPVLMSDLHPKAHPAATGPVSSSQDLVVRR